MAINKVVMNTADGESVLMDLTGDTVTPETLLAGATAHSANGESIVGTLVQPITYVESTNLESADTLVSLRSLESGTYILYGKFKPFDGSSATFTFSTGMLVSIIKTTSVSYAQVFYSKYNQIQYLEITDESYTRNDAKLVNMMSTADLITTIDDTSTDEQYPTAKAVYTYIEDTILGGEW